MQLVSNLFKFPQPYLLEQINCIVYLDYMKSFQISMQQPCLYYIQNKQE